MDEYCLPGHWAQVFGIPVKITRVMNLIALKCISLLHQILVAVGNGRLRSKINNNDGTTTTTWAVVNPINNYDIIPYIGKYVHFGEIYKGEKGNLEWIIGCLIIILKKQKNNLQKRHA